MTRGKSLRGSGIQEQSALLLFLNGLCCRQKPQFRCFGQVRLSFLRVAQITTHFDHLMPRKGGFRSIHAGVSGAGATLEDRSLFSQQAFHLAPFNFALGCSATAPVPFIPYFYALPVPFLRALCGISSFRCRESAIHRYAALHIAQAFVAKTDIA